MTLANTLKRDHSAAANDSASVGQMQSQALQKANITEQILTQLENDYQGLTINGINDKPGLKIVHDGRMYCRSLRITAQKICKAGREEAIAEQRRWIDAEKAVTTRIKKVEDELHAVEKRITDEKERIKKEKQEAEARRVASIIERFAVYGRIISFNEASAMTEEDVQIRLEEAKQEHEAKLVAEEEARKEREETERKQREEAELLRIEREKLEAQRLEIEELKREQIKVIETLEPEAEIKRAEQEAAERAAIAERERIEQEKRRTEDMKAERIKREKEAEEQRPDKEKLLALAKAFTEYPLPSMSSFAGHKIISRVSNKDGGGMLQRMADYIVNKANEL